jgi:hypothetical protein
MMGAAKASKMSVHLYMTTWCNITENIFLHGHHQQNLKSQTILA